MYVNCYGDIYNEILYVKPSYSVLKIERENKRGRTERQFKNQINLKDNKHDGSLSKKATKRVRMMLDYMVLGAKNRWTWDEAGKLYKQYKLTFATLTLPVPQFHSDLIIKNQCLNQLLIELAKYYSVNNYLWKAEPQANGNIHFHMALDKFIPYKELQDIWNRIINKLGYVDAFEKIHGHSNPPTTDISSIKKVGKISAYFSEEFIKEKSKDYMNCDFPRKNHKKNQKGDKLYYSDKNIEDAQLDEKLNQYYFQRRDIEGKLWAAGGKIAHTKKLILDLNGKARDAIASMFTTHPHLIKHVEVENPVNGEKVTIAHVLLISMLRLSKSIFPEIATPVKEFIEDLKLPWIRRKREPKRPPELKEIPIPIIPEICIPINRIPIQSSLFE